MAWSPEVRTAALQHQCEEAPGFRLFEAQEIKQLLLKEAEILPYVYGGYDYGEVTPASLHKRCAENITTSRMDFAFVFFLQRAAYETIQRTRSEEISIPTAQEYAGAATSILLSKSGLFPISAGMTPLDTLISDLHYIFTESSTFVPDYYGDGVIAAMSTELEAAITSGIMFSAIYNQIPVKTIQKVVKNPTDFALHHFKNYIKMLPLILTPDAAKTQ